MSVLLTIVGFFSLFLLLKIFLCIDGFDCKHKEEINIQKVSDYSSPLLLRNPNHLIKKLDSVVSNLTSTGQIYSSLRYCYLLKKELINRDYNVSEYFIKKINEKIIFLESKLHEG